MMDNYLVGSLIVLINALALLTKKGKYVPVAIAVSLVLILTYLFL